MKNILLLFASLILFSCSNNEEENNTPNASIPEVTTSPAYDVNWFSANIKGNIISDGGSQITQYGIIWSTTQNPTIALTTKTTEGSLPSLDVFGGQYYFIRFITNLPQNTTYYVRAYATNSAGTAYGNEVSFTTGVLNPQVTTQHVRNITLTTAVVTGGYQNPSGGSPSELGITACGFIWSTAPNPTIALPTKTVETGTQSSLESRITGLSISTVYYVRAYATNSYGTTYGNQISFTNHDPFYSMYPSGTVFCIDQVTPVYDVTNPNTGKTWMDRNLGTIVGNEVGDIVNHDGDLYQWGRRADGHQCRNSATTPTLSSTDQPNHNNFIIGSSTTSISNWRNPHNPNLWQGANGINNPCPAGYRLPTSSEINNEFSNWNTSPLKYLTESGVRLGSNGQTMNTGSFGHNWTSSVDNYNQSYYIDSGGPVPQLLAHPRNYGMSIRCIKN